MTKRRKRHSPEEIVLKLQTADWLDAEGRSGEETNPSAKPGDKGV